MNNNEKQANYDDFLKDLLTKPAISPTPPPLMPNKPSVESKTVSSEFIPQLEKVHFIPKPNIIANISNSMLYEDVLLDSLPLGKFYHVGTRIQFRDLTVKEIEHFSTLDESTIFDFKDKLNDILENCVIFENSDGTIGSYLDLKEGDRTWFVYMIREKTFPKGKVLTVSVDYTDDNNEVKKVDIELVRGNLDIYRDDNIMEYYDTEKKCFKFETTLREEPYYIAPPTIGLRRCFDQYLKIKIDKKSEINKSFFKIAPLLYPHITYINYEELLELEKWFETGISKEEFAFLYDLVENNLKIGIKGLKKKEGSTNITTTKMYPNRLSTLFLFSNAFGLFLKK